MLSFRVFAATYHRLLFSLPNLVAARPPLLQNFPLSLFDFPFSSKFFIIRTSEKCVCKPFTIRTYKTLDF